jgi:hypothetical protein
MLLLLRDREKKARYELGRGRLPCALSVESYGRMVVLAMVAAESPR